MSRKEKRFKMQPDIYSSMEYVTELFDHEWTEDSGLTIDSGIFTGALSQLMDYSINWLVDFTDSVNKIASINNLVSYSLARGCNVDCAYMALKSVSEQISMTTSTMSLVSRMNSELRDALMIAIHTTAPTVTVAKTEKKFMFNRLDELMQESDRCRSLTELYTTLEIAGYWVNDFYKSCRTLGASNDINILTLENDYADYLTISIAVEGVEHGFRIMLESAKDLTNKLIDFSQVFNGIFEQAAGEQEERSADNE